MGKTYRTLPAHWNRTPKHKSKLVSGISSKHLTTAWDEKPIAAIKEIPECKQPNYITQRSPKVCK